MTRYRLYTEDKNAGRVISAIADAGIDGATVYETSGIWKGNTEASIVIEILIDESQDKRAAIFALADRIKSMNNQEAAMITIDKNVEVHFV